MGVRALRCGLCVYTDDKWLFTSCRWRQHEAALLRCCLCVGLCVPGNSTAALSQLQGQVFSLVGPRHVVPQHFPHRRVDVVRVREPLGRSVRVQWACSCSGPGYWTWTRFPAVCFARRGQQGPRPGPTVAKGWRAGCVVFPGRCPKSETCHTAKQTLGTFPKIVFFFFSI